jgi:3-oxoacyl-[acyl-carrier-protein] synthase II
MNRVVVTGIGLLTPLGLGTDATWKAVCAGQSGVGPITQFDASAFPSRIAGEVKNFEPTRWMEAKDARVLDRFLQLAIAAAQLAIEDAGLPPRWEGEQAERAGCYIGTGMGGLWTIEKNFMLTRERGPRHGFTPYLLPSVLSNMAPGQISIRHNLQGPNMALVSACASGAHALGEAMRLIRQGTCDVMVAGGAEATVSPLCLGGFASMQALSKRNDSPAQASRPFDAGRDGFVVAEGAGVLILEALDHALHRGAHIHAELVGYGATGEAHHMTAPDPTGSGAARCMRAALTDAQVDVERVRYVNAHGTSTRQNDAAESAAVRRVFGAQVKQLCVSSTKSMTGHMLGAAGAVEGAFCALAVEHGVVPPTINYESPDPACDLDYVPNEARKMPLELALSNSFGFGGSNAALLFSRFV